MERKSEAEQINRAYEKIEPPTEWAKDDKFDTLIVSLPDFQREQVKVQVTSSNKLRISGERPLGNNKWISFRNEFPIPSNYDANEISAKFEGGKLFIKHPKIITLADDRFSLSPRINIPEMSGKIYPSKNGVERAASRKTNAFLKDKTAANLKSEDLDGGGKSTSGAIGKDKSVDKAAAAAANSGKMNLVEEGKRTSGASAALEKGKKVDKAAPAPAPAPAESGKKDLAEEGKSSSGARASMEKDKKVVKAAAAAAEAGSNSNDQRENNKFISEDMKQALGGLVMELKKGKKLLNLTVSVLLVLVACIYAKSAIGYIGKSKI